MPGIATRDVTISIGGIALDSDLEIPAKAKGIVVFAHGSGSSRLSPRNRFVAEELTKAGFATLLLDLLTPAEDREYSTRFNIDLLTERLIGAVHWLDTRHETSPLLVGLFGASTGAAAALRAAAALEGRIEAVVSRGGRPDLAGSDLPKVLTPTLFIVGGEDRQVLELNRQAQAALPADTITRLEIVERATHLFEEPGALEQVSELAADWFSLHSAHMPDVWDGG